MHSVGWGRRALVLLLALVGVSGASCIIRGSLRPPSETGTQWARPELLSCLHTYAAAKFQSGAEDSAATLELAALSRLPDDAPERIVKTLSRDLERYRERADLDRQQGTTVFWPE
jgi:hypothetical protein